MPLPRSHRLRNARTVVGVALLAAGATTGAAHAQWTVVNLHPPGAPASEARGVHNGQQVGFAGDSAVVWTGTAESAIVLNPTPDQPAMANCVEEGAQGGHANVFDGELFRNHAGIWNGSAKTFIDLHPAGAISSQITAMYGGTQVGTWFPPSEELFSLARAGLWRGTSESFVDLTPAHALFAEVRGVYDDEQVGGDFSEFLPHACMWHETAESFVDLEPPNAIFSLAICTNRVNQFGIAIVWDGKDFASARAEVGRWSGTPESWVDMTPADRFAGAITAVDGGTQVGCTAGDPMGNAPFQAALWSGTAESYVDLHSFLPPEYTESTANGIWHDEAGVAYVVGWGLNTETNRTEAIMWVSGSECSADFNDSGTVNSQDFFDFVAAFFAGVPAADFNEDAVINSQDFFDFLAVFFEGC